MTTPLVPSSPLFPGKKLDRYELVCPIAEGGMASVWTARLTGGHGFERFVAIKTILPQFAADARFQKMFVEESRIASRIEHANVTQILDVGEQDGLTYLVMEYVDGDSLWVLHRALLRKKERVPLGILLRIMVDVCGGLHAAHELRDPSGSLLRVVHRDVSPQNILVSARGMAKLIDFGIAKVIDGTASDANTGPLKGKVRYMAPEQARGEALDRRADIWAAGAILYYLLSGRAPCEAENEVQTLIRLRGGPAPEPLPSTVPDPVATVIMRALGMTPESRYPMAAELQRALENAMSEAQVTTTTAGVAAFLAEQAGEAAQKRKSAIALGLKTAADRSSSQALESRPSQPGSVPPAATGSTMRTAAVEVTQALPAPGRGLPTAGLLAGVLIVLAGLAFFAVRVVHRPQAPASASPVPPEPAPAASAAPSASGPAIRTIDVRELPAVQGAAPPPAAGAPLRAPAPARAATPVASSPTAPPPAKPAASARTRIDDGF